MSFRLIPRSFSFFLAMSSPAFLGISPSNGTSSAWLIILSAFSFSFESRMRTPAKNSATVTDEILCGAFSSSFLTFSISAPLIGVRRLLRMR